VRGPDLVTWHRGVGGGEQKGEATISLSKTNILVTGASSGLGLATTKRFAQMGANVILLSRTDASGASAVAEVEREVSDASVRLMVCDLASMASIDQFVSNVKAEYAALDLLFNNAAVMKRDRTVTEDGFEMMFQVNYLAPFILMTSFLDLLQKSSTHLVLNNARPSGRLRLDFDDLQFSRRYRMYNSFFRTKLCLALATLELAERPEAAGTNIHLAVPRPFRSGLVREVPRPAGWLKNLLSASVDKAANDIVHVARSDAARAATGKVFEKREEVPPASYWRDAAVRSRLRATTEAMIEQIGGN
jgi:retinol dehydrogenase-13